MSSLEIDISRSFERIRFEKVFRLIGETRSEVDGYGSVPSLI